MMASTHPLEYAEMKELLPEIADETREKIEIIIRINLDWEKALLYILN
jgi:ArsR family metal-binding transcriptional regulator